MSTFTNGNKKYTLKYNLESIEAIENMTGKSVINEIAETKGMLPVSDARAFFTTALYTVPDGEKVKAEEANKIFNQIANSDYISICENIGTSVVNDCPFLFRNAI